MRIAWHAVRAYNNYLPIAADISLEDLAKVLKSFPLDSAPGPSGLRIQHLLEAMGLATKGPLLEQLGSVVNTLAQGLAPEELAPHLGGAGLMALGKPKGGGATHRRGGSYAKNRCQVPMCSRERGNAVLLSSSTGWCGLPPGYRCRYPRQPSVGHSKRVRPFDGISQT